ncbi:Fur family transcriptional regulator [Paraburkholderia bannensis]|uniref:Fur family transcriptional regulator n=1 Tax=Paraburkholderia bannensis TaxID=765414 RepID=UPI0012EB3F95|nr:Fur family transcriptional regulator [Paraburkholderia bannensis]
MTTENERDVTRSICAALKRARMRPTSSRIAVLKVFLDYPDQHMTADEIFRHVPEGTEQCSLASVYRSLAQLVTSGMVISSWVGENRVVYESNPGFPHSHIICSMCGAIENFTDSSLSDQQEKAVRDRNFDYLGCNVLLFGRCPHCKVDNDHSRIQGRLVAQKRTRIHG